ncbi:MAG TPA: iron-sulfur cluster assembly scaffold protein [Geminicoccus sp.]|jgi:nitrogen fixation NifU-like protein|uniref:iron-sulfur cluster assembly scaffold protein n=1 Tax=Geminicoccus sp. TaxID=2024832 RepID=UPI002E369DE3|nr:iron-sulfur cluster assembly scaffold protein [Geminicoccus sp.]HEX2527732.1 iron-sulfur cluster assembly scaffold protein [Geminicoccus sp.]
MNDALYDQAIIAEARSKTGAGRLEAPSITAECDNPLCGDRIALDLLVDGGKVADIAHKTRGCLLTQASASLLARHAKDASAADARELRDAVSAFLHGKDDERFAILTPVRNAKSRWDCVTLPFQALSDAISDLEKRS